jgi:UDP-N-acetylmuramoylalanine--D-glutamate ligase
MVLPLLRDLPALEGKRVTVMGLGLFGGGVGVTRFLVGSGARVTVTDSKSEADLRESVDQLRSLPVAFKLGGHDERDFKDADLVIVNPAVPETNPYLRLARALETEMNLFFKLCRAKTILGVTGSNGKTTTTTLIGEILKKHPRRSWVGGNIGMSPRTTSTATARWRTTSRPSGRSSLTRSAASRSSTGTIRSSGASPPRAPAISA